LLSKIREVDGWKRDLFVWHACLILTLLPAHITNFQDFGTYI